MPGKIPFYFQSDPVSALFVAIQKWVGAPVTGIWDLATHEGFVGKLNQNEPEPAEIPWGDIQVMTYLIGSILDPPEDAPSFAFIAPLYAGLGVPSGSVSEFADWVGSLSQDEIEAAETALKRAADAVLLAESGEPQVTPAQAQAAEAAAAAAMADAAAAEAAAAAAASGASPAEAQAAGQAAGQAVAEAAAAASPAPSPTVPPGTPSVAVVGKKSNVAAVVAVGATLVMVGAAGWLIWKGRQAKRQAAVYEEG